MSDLERYAELWKTHHGYDDFYLEKNEEQEFQSLKDKIEQDLKKAKKYNKIAHDVMDYRIELVEENEQQKQELQVKVLEIAESIRSGEYDEL